MAKATEIKLSKMLSSDRVVDLISSKRENVIRELVQVMSTSKAVGNRLELYQAISEREKNGSTGVGHGCAVPHTKVACVSDFVIAIGRKPEGIAYEAPDGQPVNVVVMVAAPEGKGDELLRVLARIVLLFRSSKFRKRILEAKTHADVVHLFKD